MHNKIDSLKKENELLKESINWYQQTYEKRKLSGIIKDRIQQFLKKRKKRTEIENTDSQIKANLVDEAKAKNYLKKKGDSIQQHFYKNHTGSFTLKTPEKCTHFFRLNIESLLPIADSVFLTGWLADPFEAVNEIYFMFEDGQFSENILPTFRYFSRQDIKDHFATQQLDVCQETGIFAFIESLPSILQNKKTVEIHILTNQNELVVYEFNFTHINVTFLNKVKLILSVVDSNKTSVYFDYETCIGPAISKLAQLNTKPETIPVEKTFGTLPINPEVSIIIPIYGRYDFIQYQLSQFANDDEIKSTEIIYVIDDPSIYNSVVMFCTQIYPIYRTSFKLVYKGINQGYAAANNFGAGFARASYLLLLNSDVIPTKKGWLSSLLYYYKKLPECGILGPMLQYEDNSIQHAGMVFKKMPFLEEFWFNSHPGKGMPIWIAQTEEIKECPAVTGACMLLTKSLYNKVEGFDESYILGDFEDSDLCLKVKQEGYKCYFLPEVRLYHLERRSQSLLGTQGWKHKLTLYNGWLHTKKWNKYIKAIDSTPKNN